MNILVLIPSLRRKMIHYCNNELMPGEDFLKSSLGWKTWIVFKTIAGFSKLEIQREAIQGYDAPNARLMAVDGKTECKLLDFMKSGRPLVLNFGSCS